MFEKISTRLIMGFIILLSIFMVSCSTQLQLVNSTVSQLPDNAEPFHKKLFVKKIVGEETSDSEKFWVGDRRISLFDLRKTINTSIYKTNLFELSDMENCDYILVPIVFKNTFTGSYTITTDLGILYKLVDKKSNEVIWESRISSTDTKAVSDAFVGAKRLRLVQEATLKENSKKLIEEMAKIKLPKE